MDLRGIREAFERVFRRPAAGAVRAPGRANLIGEHTDYNDGFVLPIAIERHTVAAYAPRPDRTIRFHSVQMRETVSVGLDAEVRPTPGAWGNYPVGVAVELLRGGVRLGGADVLLDSTVPVGAGLSSSAALEVATALALMAAAGVPRAVDGADLARLCQRAENDFAGAPCGIMDQSTAVMARAGTAMLMDCRSGEIRHVPFDDPRVVLLVVDTRVRHDIGEGGYPLRRRQCRQAAERLGVGSLRDVSMERLRQAARAADGQGGGRELHCELLKRVRHVVGEIDRTLRAARALEGGEYRRFGELMFASHASLRDDYEVSCAELDVVVEVARTCPGVYGARMTGGGFGGCALVLVEADAADAAAKHIASTFRARFARRCAIFATRAAGGAGQVQAAG